EMFALLMLAAFLFWSPSARGRGLWFFLGCLAALSAALLAGWTRSIWIATGVAALYLIWNWKRWLIALAPIVLIVALLIGPSWVRTRANSIFQPHDRAFRVVTWRTGLRMVEAHPWLGVGPEQIKPHGEANVSETFLQYVPPNTPRPLPDGW